MIDVVMKFSLGVLAACACCFASAATGEETNRVLPRAHAHNDYEHERPLLDALEHGFGSVEADVWLVDSQLLVAHDRDQVRAERTLEALYLEPLWERFRKHGGVYPQDYANADAPFHLMIDFKSAGGPTYGRLRNVLRKYHAMLSRTDEDGFHPGAVTIVISGNRPTDSMATWTNRYCGIDGRPGDVDSAAPVDLLPWISDNWFNHFRWRGVGEMPPVERDKLQAFVEKVHAGGRKLRFWATPDTPAMWRVLHDAGADFINTDDLPGLRGFLLAQEHAVAAE